MSLIPAKLRSNRRAAQLEGMLRSKTARNTAILFGGNFLNTALSMVAVIFVSRALGPADFGILATFNAVMGMIIGLTDLGLGTASIKLISKYRSIDTHRSAVVMKVIVKLEIAIGLSLGILGVLLSVPIAQMLGGDHLLLAVRLGFAASIFASAAAFFGSFFVAYEQFIKNALVNLSGAVLRTGLVLVFFLLSALSLTNVLIAYAIVPIFFFFFGFVFIPKDFLIKTTRNEEKTALSEIFHFSKWVFLSYIATSIAGRLDIFLILRYKGSEAVGLYAAAQQLVTVMPMLIGAVSTVLLPKVSQLVSRSQFNGYIKRVLFGSTLLTLILLPVLLFGDILIRGVFGGSYVNALDTFKILFAGYLLALFTNPIGIVLYSLNKPKILTYINYMQLILSIVLLFILVPSYGTIGAALAFFAINLLGTLVTLGVVRKQIKRLPE